MPYVALPTSNDLTALMTDAGITPPSSARLDAAVKGALGDWNRITRWNPFLAPSTTSSGTYAASTSPVTIAVADSSIFTVGLHALIDPGAAPPVGSNAEQQSVTAITDATHITLAALTNAHNGGVTPFYVLPSAVRYFDPPGARPMHPQFLALRGGGKLLELDAGLISIVSLTVMTTLYTLGKPGDPAGVGMYWLQPIENIPLGRPYEFIEFWAPVLGSPQTIIIEGFWGYSWVVDEAAWEAMLSGAAKRCLPPIAAKISGGLAEKRQGQQMERYAIGRDAGVFGWEGGLWQADWDTTIRDYRRFGF